ncbi:copper chaperone PCu(A)C [Grimontia hollisae]|uniref:copper chaperone PCu(A)C n=1 Tax=Grimontia hollisae TaxID=673 RepID=UPI001302EF41|nr:copper chaperone PCu(A)C [Grimontia hollisae]
MIFRASLFVAVLGMASFAAYAAVDVVGPFARATPPHAPNSAAFMVLSNDSDKKLSLVEASTPVAGKVELHNHVMKDGMMQMRQVKAIDIPANGSTELKPGGLHVMLFNLSMPLKEGETLPLTLLFSDGSEITQEVPIRKVMAGAKMEHNRESAH